MVPHQMVPLCPSELNWAEKGFKLRQETRYPESTNTTLTVTAAGPETVAMRLRIPAWLQSPPTVKVNGQVLNASAAPAGYLSINRSWKAGDKVEIDLPMHLHVEAMPDDRKTQAFLYGPLVLAGDLGGEGLTDAHISGPNLRVGAPDIEQSGSPLAAVNKTPPIQPVEIPTFRAATADPSSWIKPAGEPLTFQTTGQTKDVTLRPLNRLLNRRYSVYWQVS